MLRITNLITGETERLVRDVGMGFGEFGKFSKIPKV